MSTINLKYTLPPPLPTPYTPKPVVWHLAWHPSLNRIAYCTSPYETGSSTLNQESGGRVFIWDLPPSGNASSEAEASSSEAPALTGVLNGPLVDSSSFEPPFSSFSSPSSSRSHRRRTPLWLPTTQSQKRTLRTCCYSPMSSLASGDVLAVGSFDGSIAIWHGAIADRSAAGDRRRRGNRGRGGGDDVESDGVGSTSASSEDDEEESVSRPLYEYQCVSLLEGHTSEVKSLHFSSSSLLLASCSRDKSVFLWEAPALSHSADYECAAVLHPHKADVKCVCFCDGNGIFGDKGGGGGGDILLSGGYDDTVVVAAEDGGDWYCSQTVSMPRRSTKEISGKKRVDKGKGGEGEEADLEEGNEQQQKGEEEEGTVWDITTSSGGTRFLAARSDGSIVIYKCYTPSELPKHAPAAVSDGVIPSQSDGRFVCVGVLQGAHVGCVYSLHAAPVSLGHGRLASCGADGELHVYREVSVDSDRPNFVRDCEVKNAHGGKEMNCVRWQGARRGEGFIATAGDDGDVKVWEYIVN